ncbi:AAA domain-containing protein [Pseudonocardia hierapolitana]|uniref:AAA domain-containing protein n=1 Tax=Pseudonocardia hierapolitana TaxID=1128676 RepID=A0A561SL85_9PSEU|nr:AAA domain-containing protein [Pseudonocardia hierapolitana]TWF75635.1 AAA domain-containing protein [Pseudonocardia hierapolitana]
MKIHDIAHRDERVVRIEPVRPMPIENGTPVRLDVSEAGITVRHGARVGAGRLVDHDDHEWLAAVVPSGAYLAELLVSDPAAAVRVLTYDGDERWPDGRQVGVDDQAVEDARRFTRATSTVADVTAWLAGEFRLDGGGGPVSVIGTGGSAAMRADAFRLVGASVVVDVRLVDDMLLVERITRRDQGQESRLTLVHGSVSFVDATRLGKLSFSEQQELKRLAEADNAYLGIWNEYNDLEREAARAAARAMGSAPYDRWTLLPDGRMEFELVRHRSSDVLRDSIGREKVGLEAGSRVAFDGSADPSHAKDRVVIGDAVVGPRGTIILEPARQVDRDAVPQRGYLAGAYTLDKVRIDRRNRAQVAMMTGATFPARQVGLILGDQRPEPVGRARRFPPLSARVKEILGGLPTEAQVAAIDLAINSRDVVLIQGPPGTGKTRVIAAIQARLAEINKEAPAVSKRVLLTSYQHDAVANLVQAADDGTLPPVKLGRTHEQEDRTHLDAWTMDLAARLAQRHDNSRPNQQVRAQQALLDRTTAYREQPFDVSATVDLLNWVAQQAGLVGTDVAFEARKLAKTLAHTLGAHVQQAAQGRLLRLARALRETPEAYADDGALTAIRVLHDGEFVDLLDDAQRIAVEEAARGTVEPRDAAPRLKAVKQDVIDRLLDGRARAGIIAAIPAVEALLDRAAAHAEREVMLAASPIDLAIEQFRKVIETQPHELRASIVAHTRALAATCQQAVSGQMRATQSVPFATVIVDEAARANPLDLMIPISLASERVVLVGDHRQLPQLLDDQLVPRLSSRHNSAVVESVLNRSLFERLFTKLRDCERRDGTKRVITLDRQFRMHPVLGSFVSEQFYAPHGEHVANGRADGTAFAHDLPGYGTAVCGWIDVPHDRGREERVGSSIRRRREAEIIVRELADGLQASAAHTFGVITFYSGQVTAIWEAMYAEGMAIRDGADYRLNPSVPWLHDARGLPRVRIGSVDAFQGREFDVVYLSTVRSNRPRPGKAPHLGFLVLPNRLCVAMSRQRRLLVAVGDAAMFTSESGRVAVPALAAFHGLTGGEHGCRRSA